MSSLRGLVGVFIVMVVVTASVGGYILVTRTGVLNLPCRDKNGFPLKTGLASGTFRSTIGKMDIIQAKFCYIGVDNTKDSVFPDSSVRIKIGFFNKLGVLKTYPARLGATDLTGNNIPVGLCVNGICNSLRPTEIVSQIKPNSILNGSIVVNDGSPWTVSDLVRKYASYMQNFSLAIEHNSNPPDYPKQADFVLQITQFTLSN